MADEIKLGDFVKKELLPIIESHAEDYKADFHVFQKEHPKLSEDRFIKARFLFDLLKEQSEEGRWSYCYHLKKNGETYQVPQASLQQLFRSVVDEEGYSGCHFFADCDEIMMLYQEMAVLMGLAAVDIRLVQDNHVNLFVPLGEGVELRMDPTTISRTEGTPLWNLPKNNYVPKGRIPEEYEKNNLARLRKTLAGRAARLGETPLSQQVAQRLLAQSLPPQGAGVSVSTIPESWQPFVKGYGDAKACYDRFLKQYSYPTVDEAVLASKNPLTHIREAEDTKKYFDCLETTVPMMERLGKTFAHVRWGGFRSLYPHFSLSEYIFLEAILSNHITYDKDRFHSETNDKNERMHLQEQFKKWPRPPFYWGASEPASFTTGAALAWFQSENINNPDTILFLADLVHLIEDHPASGF